ncbi:hypothetical protein E1A91_A03G142900v1 [Gossypium mustelinum]|uniref:F-box domain-containing protein n=3 Tax=Gossypium TaxID=3633 RepID=A0A5D2ZYE3_GOSMU|nr:hypothetical protein ES288_A03G157400v1 [Gossypium darwinii]TYI36632.1 hypothetical protein ES332_A03G155000v1 [Gossypium tomentosum]TYJ43284.1 hypothetical protein E1A91_A03G142900v1 [Gossypium mustelinum]
MKVEELEKRKSRKITSSSPSSTLINNLDDGCLMHIFSFLSPIPVFEALTTYAKVEN